MEQCSSFKAEFLHDCESFRACPECKCLKEDKDKLDNELAERSTKLKDAQESLKAL